MTLHAWSSARYVFPLPEGHRFPVAKYALLRQRVLDLGILSPERLHEPERAPLDDVLLVHDVDYVSRFSAGTLSPDEMRRVGFVWSEQLVERSFRAVGGTCEAARFALQHGIAMNLAGGTHHAFPDHGEGFCVFNDVAIAIRALQRDGLAERVCVVDLDVHQGNGTHAIFAEDDRVYTFSMHAARNFPFHKVPGRRDVELNDGTEDEEYLELLARNLPGVLAEAEPDLVVYLAGADPLEHDRLGRLRLTFAGLARRDAYVLECCRDVGLPIAITISGGYSAPIEHTVAAHAETARIAATFSRLATHA